MSFNLTEAFEDQVIRISGTPEAPLFCATDVCAVLGIANSRDALAGLDEDEKDGVGLTDTIGRTQTMQCVTESGLYHLAFKSRKAAAKRFRRWVTQEVLPAIRKNGAFHAEDARRVARDTQRMSLTQWLGSLGLDLRNDARRCSEVLRHVSTAASALRWYATPSKGQNADSLFQEVPLPVLELAEGLYIQGTGAWKVVRDTGRTLGEPAQVEVMPPEKRDLGGTIHEIIARRKAEKLAAEAAAQAMEGAVR